VYRDLKPENVLLKLDGTPRLSDLGLAKHIADAKTFTVCGTPGYLAPEVVGSSGHDYAVDWWCLGIFIHELLVGSGPFDGRDPLEILSNVTKGINQVNFEESIKPDEQQLIVSLCDATPSKRLPMVSGGREKMLGAKLFAEHIDWASLRAGKTKPPFLPPETMNEACEKVMQGKFFIPEPGDVRSPEPLRFSDPRRI
jgi:serine/threonine protein kinase